MIRCALCEGADVVKFGFNQTSQGAVQKYRCNSCNKFFSHSDRLPNHRIDADIVSECIDLYMEGLSYHVVQRHVLQKHGLKVSHVIIYRWIQNCMESIKRYTDSLRPKLSAVWQMDETYVWFKGHIFTEKAKERNACYCWACIDTATRYVIDMYLAQSNNKPEGEIFLKRICKTTPLRPIVVVTDGNLAYPSCIKQLFPGARHINIKKISLKPNTSFIERFNGTLRNRTKTMRCFKSFGSCQTMLTVYQTYYNFLRPHMALDDRTPAQAAGIEKEFPDRWTSLIRQAYLFDSQI